MITGAASGIGRSLARRLSRSGAPVAIADVDETGLKETARSLRGPVLTRVLDVRDADDQHRFAAEVRQWLASLAHGARLAAVFNNAGVAVASSVLDADPGDDEWLRQINFDGVVNGTRAFLPILVEQDSGVIVNTSSVFGLLGMPNQSAYCASKFAVRGFTDSLRQELRGTGVSAVTVHPGGIRTNIARNARVRKDPEGLGRSHDQMAADFEAITMTTPDKAAQIICRGVEQGKARILVGPDAYVFDALARVAPTHYYDIMARLEKRLRSRQAASSLDRVPGGFGDVLPPGRHGPPYVSAGQVLRVPPRILLHPMVGPALRIPVAQAGPAIGLVGDVMFEVTATSRTPTAGTGTGCVPDLREVPEHYPGIVTPGLPSMITLPGGDRPDLDQQVLLPGRESPGAVSAGQVGLIGASEGERRIAPVGFSSPDEPGAAVPDRVPVLIGNGDAPPGPGVAGRGGG